MDQHETTPQITTKPVCAACATGYHDELLIIPEQCACPCHGTEVLPEDFGSVAIADECRSIADSIKTTQDPLGRIVYEGFGIDCRLQTGVDV